MKKIKLFPIYVLVLLIAFSSCNSEDDVMDANLKKESETIDADYSETAFAKIHGAERCFDNDGFMRWGWTNGPFTENSPDGFYELALYAAAGQCDYTKGVYVGRVLIWYNEAEKSARVKYHMLRTRPYILYETHLYLGPDKYPIKNNGKETVAPGQYPYKHSNLGGVKDDWYTIENIPEGGFYVIAHAVVGKE